ncbi:MAG: hypothetical protein AAF560_00265 [Acidobacteriota bacterium]
MSEQTADDQIAEEHDSQNASEGSSNDNVRAINDAKQRVQAAVGQARERFQHAAADVGDRFQQASATAQERSHQAREAARARYQATSEQLQDGYTRVRKDVDQYAGDVNDFVRHKPGTAVLIAALAGFLLGLLFRPRHD